MTEATNTYSRPVQPDDRGWINAFLKDQWGDSLIVTRGRVHHADLLPGFMMVLKEGERETTVGLVTYAIDGEQCEVVTLDSSITGLGIGTRLLQLVEDAAWAAGCMRLWLITTNDNTPALRFYQKRGWRLAALHRDAIRESRKIKPIISEIGIDGIPIRDEIELEKFLE